MRLFGQTGTQRTTLIVMIICLMSVNLPAQTINVVLPLLRADWQLDYSAAGILIAAYQGGYVLGAALVLIQERANQQRVVLAGTILAAVGSIALLLVNGLTGAVIVRAIAGVGMGWVYMPGLLLLAKHFPAGSRGTSTGFYVAAFSIGQSVSLAVTGWLLPFVHWQVAAALIGLFSLVGTGVLLANWRVVTPPSETASAVESPTAERTADASALSAPSSKRTSTPAKGLPWLVLLPVLLVILTYTIHSWELYAVRTWLPAYLTEHLMGMGWLANPATAMAANVSAGSALIGAFMTASGGIMADRFGALRTAGALLILSGVSTALLGWVHQGPIIGVVLILTLSSLSMNADSPIYSAVMTEWSPAGIRGRMMAIYTVSGFSAATIAPMVVGRGLDQWGWGLTFTVIALPNLLALGAVFYLIRLQRSRRDAQNISLRGT